MYTNNLNLVGNLVDAPDVQVTQSGVVRARFRLASTERRRDPVTDTWQDGDSVFVDVTCWRRLAQHVGNSLGKGDRVIVLGRLRQWTAERDGIRRAVLEIEAEAVGPDLQRGMVTIARPRRMDVLEGGPTEGATADAGADTAVIDVGTGEITGGTGEVALEVGGREPLEDAALGVEFDARPLADAAV